MQYRSYKLPVATSLRSQTREEFPGHEAMVPRRHQVVGYDGEARRVVLSGLARHERVAQSLTWGADVSP